jgi:Gly-Xaa carboxypeptidase
MSVAAHTPESSFLIAIRSNFDKVAQGNRKAQQQLAQVLYNMRYYFRTTQSVGKINGGVKINTIPKTATTLVNLRLAVKTSIS